MTPEPGPGSSSPTHDTHVDRSYAAMSLAPAVGHPDSWSGSAMKLSRPTALASCVAAALMPAALVLSSAPTSAAATALFAEGATRPSGEAQTAFGGAFCEQNTCRSLGTGTV